MGRFSVKWNTRLAGQAYPLFIYRGETQEVAVLSVRDAGRDSNRTNTTHDNCGARIVRFGQIGMKLPQSISPGEDG